MRAANGSAVRLVHVVVPAHDEEQLIGANLDSVQVALRRAAGALGVTTRLTVVLDRCTDATAEVVAARSDAAGLDVVAVDAGNVGAARRAGALRATVLPAGITAAQVWLLSTDADTVVPPNWVLDHLRLAEDVDLVVGSVRPEPTGLSPAVLRAWSQRHTRREAHVHGANLGVRLSAYLAIGGFPAWVEHEDVALVAALRASGTAAAHATTVTTSARHRGRVRGGFAGYLRALSAEVDHS